MAEKTVLKPLLTRWGEKLDRECPLNAYPRPQLRRQQWECLNGVWEYAIRDDGERPELYDGEIVVPFSPESALSGVGRQLMPGQTLWYRRVLRAEVPDETERLLLHFGAVDQLCIVWLNGSRVGENQGGYWPFSIDITAALQPGENTLEVSVKDYSDIGHEAWGKQKLDRGGIWYTGQSGIWQTVWCERVPKQYIEVLVITPLWRQAAVEVQLGFTGVAEGQALPVAGVQVLDGDAVVAEGDTQGGVLRLELPGFKSWSPDEPFLYGLRITAGQDMVESYFGMREFGTVRDSAGVLRPALNGKPIFHSGLLDQGYWSDGMYTPPDDEAMVWELTQIKQLGFNMLRKHIKIEPLRWYYHCDRLGLLVWQDFVSGGGPYRDSVIQIMPFVGIRLKDNRYAAFGRDNAVGREAFERDMYRTVRLLYNAACIAVWVPFNEGWGQFDALEAERQLRHLDDTRLIDHASGWHDQGGGDFASHHVYYRHFRPKRDTHGRVLALTEFGGYSRRAEGHMASDKLFGYKIFDEQQDFEEAIERLYREDVLRYVPQGLSVAIYTQVSDVEDEINGLFTYDRKKLKLDADKLRRINAELIGLC